MEAEVIAEQKGISHPKESSTTIHPPASHTPFGTVRVNVLFRGRVNRSQRGPCFFKQPA